MAVTLNPEVERVRDPPIAEARSWIAGRCFTATSPLLDMAQAVPSYPPSESLRRYLAERTALFETAQYTPIAGIPALRAALADRVSVVYGGRIVAPEVVITAGCNQAFCLAVLALARAGDEIILPVPYYFNHYMWLQMQNITAIPLPSRPDRGGVPDPEEAACLISGKTRAIILVTPNNPTGAVYPAETLAEFRDLAASRGIALVLDETYRDFLDSEAPHRLFCDEMWRDTVVQLYSFSKAYSLTGYRVGAIVAGERIAHAVTKIMDTISICAARIAQDAALFGLLNLSDWVAGKRGIINRRRDAVRALFRSNTLGYQLISSGAYFAYVHHPFDGEAGRDVARRLADEQNLLCLPGSFFGPDQDRCLRLAYANVGVEDMPVLAQRLRDSC